MGLTEGDEVGRSGEEGEVDGDGSAVKKAAGDGAGEVQGGGAREAFVGEEEVAGGAGGG